jgi:hypothetical protein
MDRDVISHGQHVDDLAPLELHHKFGVIMPGVIAVAAMVAVMILYFAQHNIGDIL